MWMQWGKVKNWTHNYIVIYVHYLWSVPYNEINIKCQWLYLNFFQRHDSIAVFFKQVYCMGYYSEPWISRLSHSNWKPTFFIFWTDVCNIMGCIIWWIVWADDCDLMTSRTQGSHDGLIEGEMTSTLQREDTKYSCRKNGRNQIDEATKNLQL